MPSIGIHLRGIRACDYRAVTGLLFVCTLVAYWERVGFSIAFTSIARETGLTDTEKGSVFAAFFSGYALTQVLGGYLASRYGGKVILALSYALWTPMSALTALLPGSSDSYIARVFACRLVIGMAQGILLPSSDLVLAHWVPSTQRGRFFAFAVSGKFLGAAVAMVTVPIVVSDLGAPATFLIAAMVGASWLAVWVCAGSDGPDHAEDTNAARLIAAGEAVSASGGGGQRTGETESVPHKHRRGVGLESSDGGNTDRMNNGNQAVFHSCPTVEGPRDRGAADRPKNSHLTATPAFLPDVTVKVDPSAWTNPESLHRPYSGLACASDEAWVAAAGASQNASSVADKEEDEEGGNGRDNLLDGMELSFSSSTDGVGRNEEGKQWSGSPERTSNGGKLSNSKRSSSCSRSNDSTRRLNTQALLTSVCSGNDSPMDGAGEDSTDSRWNGVAQELCTASRGTLGNNDSGRQSSITSTASSNASITSQSVVVAKGKEGVAGDRMAHTETTPMLSGGGTPVMTTTAGKTRTEAMAGRRHQVQKWSSKVPWRAMGTSSAAWAGVAANIGATVGVNVVTSWLPTYFEELFLVDLRDLGVVTLMTPYLTMAVFSILGGNLFGWLTNNRGISRSSAFKLITGVSFACAIVFLLSMGLATSPTTGTVLSSLALASMALSRGGWSTYHVEISSLEHSAMLYSAANTASSAASVGAIGVTGKLLDSFGGAGQASAWVMAMGAVGAMCGACGIFFLVFSKGDEILFPSTAVAAGGKYATLAAAAAAGERWGDLVEGSSSNSSSTSERSVPANAGV